MQSVAILNVVDKVNVPPTRPSRALHSTCCLMALSRTISAGFVVTMPIVCIFSH